MSGSRKSFYILLPLISGLIALLLVEAGLRAFYPIPFSLERNMYFEPDPYTGFRHRPSGLGHYLNGVEAVANSRGQRDDEIDIPKLPGVKRILVLGDSFTVGANVELRDAYPQVLEDLWNEPGGSRVEVVNTGTGGWSPFQYAQFYEHYGDQFEPDLVLVGFFVGNDAYADRFALEDTLTAVMGRRISRDAGNGLWVRTRVFLYENSHVARALMSGGVTDLNFDRDDCSDFNDYFLAVQKGRLFNHTANPPEQGLDFINRNADQLKRIRDKAAADGIPVVVAIFPDETQVNSALQTAVLAGDRPDRYDFAMPQRLLHELLDERDISWVDLQESFENDSRCLFMNDSHWVPEGHKFVAEQLHQYILDNNLL